MAGVTELFKNAQLSEEDKAVISKAWTKKLSSVRREIEEELREEFAQKFEHDKAKILEGVDGWVTDTMDKQIESVKEERQNLAKDRVKYHKALREFDDFAVKKLAEIASQFHSEREDMKTNMGKFAEFIAETLANEVKELADDQKELANSKYELIKENRAKLAKTKRDFIIETSRKVEKFVNAVMRKEVYNLREDIARSRENAFGQKIFEAFASEFAISHLHEGQELQRAHDRNDRLQKINKEGEKIIIEQRALVEEVVAKLKNEKEQNIRKDKMDKMLRPFDAKNREIMEDILEGVETAKLEESFKKYLPSLLRDNNTRRNVKSKRPLNEESDKKERILREHTGNRKMVNEGASEKEVRDNVVSLDERMRKLAGIK